MSSATIASDGITGDAMNGESAGRETSTSSASTEKALMLSALNSQRKHVLGILDGLTDEALRRPVLPTGWSCLGLVRHLTVDVEQLWFSIVAAGQRIEPDAVGWQVGPDESAQAVLDAYRQEVQRANAVIEATPIDAPLAFWPAEQFGEWRLHDLRELIMHVITETACHAGHLDAVRELIDGETWFRN
jgi:uncharacterized damage-inducible protein DinB